MSNKNVPTVYRTVIDEVITAIKPEFDEYGVSEEILAELQHKWESKVMASNVADFETPPPSHPPPPPPPQHSYTALPHQHPQYSHYPYAPAGGVKTEPVDNRYMLSGPPPLGSYALPPLPGPQLNGAKSSPSLYPSGPPASSFPAGSSGRPPVAPPARQFAASPVEIKPNIKNQQQRIPQVDGPSSSSSGSLSPPPKHSSSPLPPAPSNASTSLVVDDEAINSDLDDSSTEGDEDAEESAVGETDIVFCTYDKVARVKNKWKCILKDGMIHINGRDYLFAKCTGEFEW